MLCSIQNHLIFIIVFAGLFAMHHGQEVVLQYYKATQDDRENGLGIQCYVDSFSFSLRNVVCEKLCSDQNMEVAYSCKDGKQPQCICKCDYSKKKNCDISCNAKYCIDNQPLGTQFNGCQYVDMLQGYKLNGCLFRAFNIKETSVGLYQKNQCNQMVCDTILDILKANEQQKANYKYKAFTGCLTNQGVSYCQFGWDISEIEKNGYNQNNLMYND